MAHNERGLTGLTLEAGEIINGRMGFVLLQEVIIHHLCIMLNHFKACMSQHGLKMQNIHAGTKREDNKGTSERVGSDVNPRLFREPAENQ